LNSLVQMKQIVIEEQLQTQLFNNLEEKSNSSGLVIGLNTQNQDKVYIVAVVPTPPNNFVVPALDPSWIGEHTRQVSAQLPGGLEILGLYIIAPRELKDKGGLLLELLKAIRSGALCRNKFLNFMDQKDQIVLHLCPNSKKIEIKVLDRNKETFESISFKFEMILTSMFKLSTCFPLDFSICLEKGFSLKNEIKNAMIPVAEDIQSSLVLLNDKLLDESTSLEKIKNKTHPDCMVDFYKVNPITSLTSNSCTKVVGCAQLQGSIYGIAYIHPKENISSAIKLLKMDVMNSFATRFDLFLEEYQRFQEEIKDENMFSSIMKSKKKHLDFSKEDFFPLHGINQFL